MIEKRDAGGKGFLTAFSLSLHTEIMASKIFYAHCQACGSNAVSKVLNCRDYTVSNEIFEVWRCSNCTFMFTQNVPDAAGIISYYQSPEYVSHSDTKKGLVNSLYHVVRNFTLKGKHRLVTKVTGVAHGTLLDIGAGTGAFAHTMQQAGWQVTGLEPDETARANASKLYKIDLQQSGTLYSLPANSFDCITLWHVLEHVHDLHGYLQKFSEVLKPSGRLLIAVPNYTSYDSGVYKESWAAYDVPRHLYHFSPKSMEVLLGRKGFTIESVKPMWFDSFYVSLLSEKYAHGKDNFIRAAWVGIVSNCKALFDAKKCSSVIYIARKK